MNQAVILEDVAISFKNRPLLTKVNFKISAGDIALLSGENGSGKSTLLKVICGLRQPKSGRVNVFGKELGPGKFAQQTAVLINSPRFINDMSGFDNLWALAQIKHQISQETVRLWMNRVGLDPTSKVKVRKYSLGMNQKLGLAQALMEDEDLILLDEPLNGLDKSSKQKIVNLVKEVHSENLQKIFIIVSHDNYFNTIANRFFEINGEEVIENV
ncbi:ABC transporter ATP-binding protein [Lactobacillus sp. ESL0701]|uniref:ABC transporter ATP-binding protein n=1 Tax=Lactobacillus sp. ESL0701 TaxID=2983217 RepID=UPI0023F9BB25|nr:ABC transporter ATP-binding protein [Lactobacillus sp. ESL0701]MDF7673056.1 ABC transporter ATP-binding protein [Lactobacillus sp. ESL0701]